MEAVHPGNETLRLSVLRRLKILDTPAEERFDRITRVAARLFNAPITLVSLVDENRQWFKSCIGLPMRETPRGMSFCAHALLGDDTLVIPDATADDRFRDNPLVTGEPFIRFYAGQPLRTWEGLPMGTLCILDREPRSFSAADRAVLKDLAGWAEEELDRVKSDFVSTVAHELRTPLTAILGFSDLILAGAVRGPEAIAEDLQAIRGNAMRLNDLVDDLLDVSKAESGAMRMDMKPVQLADVVRNVVLIVAPAFSAKGQPLRVDLPPDLPLVQGDAGRLEQVVANLLTNANKYTLAGGEVRVYAEATAEAVSLVVADSGVGLTVHEQSRLFGKFFRARNAATRDVDGTGLGLVITRSLVRQHGGDITVQSRPGQGSIFTVVLPRSS